MAAIATHPDLNTEGDVAAVVLTETTTQEISQNVDGEQQYQSVTPTQEKPNADHDAHISQVVDSEAHGTSAELTPTTRDSIKSARVSKAPWHRAYASYREFRSTFGVLGLPMVAVFLCASMTMLFFAVVQVIPTPVANWLMDTSELDDGEFWLLQVPSIALVVVSTTMLVVFGLCYLSLALAMIFFRGRILRWARSRHHAHVPATSAVVSHRSSRSSEGHPPPTPTARRSVFYELTSEHGVYHAYYNALFDLPKLTFQTATIATYLTEGFPLPLIELYLAMLLVSWLLSFYRFQDQKGDPNLVVKRMFLLFDLFFSVFAPLIVLAYAYHQFNMDREAFAIREETLSSGSYDSIARLFADPVEIDVTCSSRRRVQNRSKARMKTKTTPTQPVHPPKARTLKSILGQAIRVHGKRRHLVFGIFAFFAGFVGILVYVTVAITTSTQNCRDMPECRVISYQWNAGAENDECPCIVYINRNEAPSTFHAWVNATDVTESLAAAAKSGHLKTVQIINRAVPELPEALRHCQRMEQLILVYTQTQSLPEWVGDFRGLHFIHVESDILHYPLHTLPTNLFANLSKLRFIRFGGAAQLTEFPSLSGLRQLTTLVLSLPHALTQLPSLDDLSALVTLVIADATHVTSLPSLQKLTSLRSFSLFRRNAMCCNGFITGSCDLTDFQCLPRADEPTVTCEPTARLSSQDKEKLKRIDAFVCSANLTSDIIHSEPTELSSDGLCGGVLFQQCQLDGRGGMCFNGRMQIVHCDVFGEYEAMRRREIARGVGAKCDPRIEAWLGCV